MKSRVALKRLWQETAPATYMKDFDKRECCNAIEKDIEVLEILKRKAELITENGIISIKINYINMFKDDFDKIMEWLNDK